MCVSFILVSAAAILMARSAITSGRFLLRRVSARVGRVLLGTMILLIAGSGFVMLATAVVMGAAWLLSLVPESPP